MGPRGPGGLCGEGDHVPGVLASDGEPPRTRPPGRAAHRGAIREDTRADRVPLRPPRRHGPAHRDDERRSHATRPRRIRLPPGATRGRAGRARRLTMANGPLGGTKAHRTRTSLGGTGAAHLHAAARIPGTRTGGPPMLASLPRLRDSRRTPAKKVRRLLLEIAYQVHTTAVVVRPDPVRHQESHF